MIVVVTGNGRGPNEISTKRITVPRSWKRKLFLSRRN